MMIFDIVTSDSGTIRFLIHGLLRQDYTVSYDNSAHMADFVPSLVSTRHYLQATYIEPATLESLGAYFRPNEIHIADSCGFRAYTQPMKLSHGCSDPRSIVPADHLRRLVVALRGDLADHQLVAKTRDAGAADETHRPIGALCNSLELLLAVKNPSNLQLTNEVSATTTARLEEILDGLKKMRRRLIAARMKVRVTAGAQAVRLR
jgi:hypothetical protein